MSSFGRRSQSVQRRRSRWAGFLGDVKSESSTFKDILSKAAVQKAQVNRDYKTYAQRSFNAIHNVVRKKPDPSRMTPDHRSRMPDFHPEPPAVDAPPESPFEFDARIPNRDRWPVRPVTAGSCRVLTPVRLRDYPGVSRAKDITCVLGAPVSADIDVF
jgi:hypothetical protein